MFLKAAGALAFTLLLGGCGVLEFLMDSQTKVYTYYDPVTAQEVFNNSRVECDGACPESVGGMVTYTDHGSSFSVGVCSLTLISKGMALTNRHCIPSDLQYEGARCKGRIRVKFPITATVGSSDHECFRVEKISGIDRQGVIDPDWAIVSLGLSSGRDFADVSTGGIADADGLVAYPSYYTYSDDSSRVVGQIREVRCTSEFKINNLLTYDNPFARIFAFGSCSRTLVKGNSGSGAFNTMGMLVGVISAVTGSSGMNLELGAKEGGGSNLACIDHFNTDAAINCR